MANEKQAFDGVYNGAVSEKPVKDNKQNGLEITEIEFLLSQDRLILQEKHLSIVRNRGSGHKMSTVSDMLKKG